MMENESYFFITLGVLLLLGLLTSTLGRRTFLPRVSLLLLFGAVIGNGALNWIPTFFVDQFGLIADMALIMIGFLLGGKLKLAGLRKMAGEIIWISVTAALVTTAMVSIGLILVGIDTNIAILLGCIASATAPTAVFDVIKESGYKGRFSELLLSIVAVDDVWALILFAIGITTVTALNGDVTTSSPFITISREIGGATLLGIVIGLPASYLTGRVRPGEPILTEALGIVFLCGGLAIMLEVSYLMATMVMGAVITNLARHHNYPFHAIENIESPFLIVFFILAGAYLDFNALIDFSIIGSVYIVSRAVGKYIGGVLGGVLGKSDKTTRTWIGLALMPQAGVGIGLVLLASNIFPEYRQTLLSVVVSSTIFFDIIGPLLTRFTLRHVTIANKTR